MLEFFNLKELKNPALITIFRFQISMNVNRTFAVNSVAIHQDRTNACVKKDSNLLKMDPLVKVILKC